MGKNELISAALEYAKRGWQVFPVHAPTLEGHCACGQVDCSSPAKHPLTPHGVKDATINQGVITGWWEKWPNANIGIATGEASGIVVLDVDPRHGGDESLADLLKQQGELPETVESLTGGGGRHIFFQYPDSPIKNNSGLLGAGLDIRGNGGYIVAPPSKHISGRQYEWEVSGHPEEISPAPLPPWLLEQLARKDTKPKSTPACDGKNGQEIPEGQRNQIFTSLAGTMRRKGMSEDAIYAALLEENRSRCSPSLSEREVRCIAASVSRYEPDEEETSRSRADKLVEHAQDNLLELFHDERTEPYALMPPNDGRRIICMNSREFNRWLARLGWSGMGKALSGDVLSTARHVLSGLACYEGKRHVLHNRVARHEGAFWIDLGGAGAIRIVPGHWEIIAEPPILFRPLASQLPLPEPVKGGDPWQVFRFVNLSDNDSRLLFVSYLVSAFIPDIPIVALVVHGVQGSAKTTLLKVVKRLIDPSIVELRGGIKDLTEYAQAAFQSRAIFFDNLSSLPDWLSDALCRTVSGEGWSKRSLFTDEDSTVFKYRRIVGLNGINLVVDKADLLDRSLIFSINRIRDESRMEEGRFWSEFEKSCPEILGGLLDTLAKAIELEPSLQLSRLPRMADFAKWGAAAAKALGYTAEDFLEAYGKNVGWQNEAALEASPVAQAVILLMKDRENWKGTPAELLSSLDPMAEKLRINQKSRNWPKDPSWMSRRLREVLPNLQALGIYIEDDRSSQQRKIAIRKAPRNAVIDDMEEKNNKNHMDSNNDSNDSKTAGGDAQGVSQMVLDIFDGAKLRVLR